MVEFADLTAQITTGSPAALDLGLGVALLNLRLVKLLRLLELQVPQSLELSLCLLTLYLLVLEHLIHTSSSLLSAQRGLAGYFELLNECLMQLSCHLQSEKEVTKKMTLDNGIRVFILNIAT